MARSTFRSAACHGAAIVALVAAQPAEAQERSFNVPAQDARKSIPEFARQAGVQISAPTGHMKGVRTNAVKGTMDVHAALKELVQGTGLEIASSSGNVIILKASTPQGNALAGAPNAGTESASSTGDEVGSSEKGVSEILVIGKKTQNVDIRRTENDARPYVVFNSEEIERSGASNLEEFFRKRLTANAQQGTNAAPQSPTGAGSTPSPNVSQINLRGLGLDETLILIDGRPAPRALQAGSGLSFTQADINGIPLAAIERVEILPSTAGGIYGAGATGGVVNVIRKRDYNGIDLHVGAGGAFRGGARSYTLEAAGGFTPNHGKTRITFSGGYNRTQPLLAGDNDLWLRSRSLFYDHEAAIVAAYDGAFPGLPVGYLPNIVSAVPGQSLTLKDQYGGASLNSDRTFISPGYAGASSDHGAVLLANAGKFDLGLSRDGSGRNYEIRPDIQTASLNFNVRHSFSNRLDAFVDASWSKNKTKSSTLRAENLVVLTPDNANNPFQETILATVPLPGLERTAISTSSDFALNSGLIWRLSSKWSLTAEYDWSRVRSAARYTENPLSGTSGDTTLTGADPDLAEQVFNGSDNPLRDIYSFPLDYGTHQVFGLDASAGNPSSTQQVVSARVAGSLVRIPGGNATLTALLEHRAENALAYETYAPSLGTTKFSPRSQAVTSAYAELFVPIVSEDMSVPFIRVLDLSASIRHDHFATKAIDPELYDALSPPSTLSTIKDSTHSLNYTGAIRWSPEKSIMLRASYATGFVPPGIGQVVAFPFLFDPGVLPFIYPDGDPLRNDTFPSGAVEFLFNGNPHLRPETSRSFSAGVVLTPTFLSNLRLSAQYTKIKKRGEVTSLFSVFPSSLHGIVEFFPERVTRAALSAEDQANGYTVGEITSIDVSNINLASTDVAAWDFSADYSLNTSAIGTFSFHGNATYQAEYRQRVLSDSPITEKVGFADGPLRWRLNAAVDWERGPWAVGWASQFYGSYRSYSSFDDVSSIGRTIARQGSGNIPSQVYHDVYARYKFRSEANAALRGLEITLGVQNLFDKRPPTIASINVGGGYSAYGDPRLRRFTLDLRKHF